MLFKTKENKKEIRYEIRMSREERTELQKRAKASNLHLSEYLIRCGLGRPIAKSNTTELVLQLMSLGKLQKELHAKDQGYKEQYLDILIAIVTAVRAIPYRITKTRKLGADDD